MKVKKLASQAKEHQSSLGVFLRQARLEKGWSQWKLAEQLGYQTSQFVSNWETGRSSPPLKALAKCLHLLNLEEEELVQLILEETEANLRRQIGN